MKPNTISLRPGFLRLLMPLLAIAMIAACGEPTQGDLPPVAVDESTPQADPQIGGTDFVSADGRNGQTTQENQDANNTGDDMAAAPEAGADADGGENRTVEEGDIYRVMHGSNMLLNLNAFRGLQIISLADVSNPSIIGRVQVSGTPVEMYQVGDRVYILMNNWQGYYGNRSDIMVESYRGGVVLVVDISDPTAPFVTGRAQVPGHIRSSRLTRGNDKEALFVVANNWGGGSSETVVKSFSVSTQGTLTAKSELSLGGYIGDIQATPQRLLVARNDWSRNNNRSEVAVIDISSPDGEMVEGASVLVKGRVTNQFNMDYRNGMLRVASGGGWTTNTNHLETFDATDIHNITPLDAVTYGDNEDLYATLFLEDSAFVVTYFRVDPFHAFSIEPDGTVTEMSEYVISGWNDFFRAVENERRLIGIGKNDENGRNTMAVSLYDITELSNPDPFIAREEVDLSHSWSEASWDHRAFSVLEKAVNVESATGEIETGLVLLPYSGWSSEEQRYISAVQIFTFSADTLTMRGSMEHGTRVRRSFVANATNNTTANLSEAELTLFNTADPDAPAELGRLDLAPNYSDLLVFGDHALRRQDRGDHYSWWGSRNRDDRPDSLQVIALSDDTDNAPTLAEIEISARSHLYKSGDNLVVLEFVPVPGSTQGGRADTQASVQVWSLSSPTNPELVDTLTISDLEGRQVYYGYDEWDYYYGYNPRPRAVELDDALVFVTTHQERELLGRTRYTTTYPRNRYNRNCHDNQGNPIECTYVTGSIRCTQLTRVDGTVEPEVCTGEYRRCTQSPDYSSECTVIDPAGVSSDSYNYTYDHYRHWQRYDFHPLDLSSASPSVAATIETPITEEAVNVIGQGNTLYFSYKVPTTVPGDSRPFVRYFFKKIDFSNPQAAVVQAGINVPGELLAVDGDTLLTRDLLWGANIVETSINKLTLINNNRARLDAMQRFVDQQVQQVVLDGEGQVLVSHSVAYNAYQNNDYYYDDYGYGYDYYNQARKLSILDASGNRFSLQAQIDVDRWANLQDARSGRALFSVPGGLLVINFDAPTNPYAQAYFATRGWPRSILVHDGHVHFAAGMFGLYSFDMDEFNLVLP